jgi:hypothetical protein
MRKVNESKPVSAITADDHATVARLGFLVYIPANDEFTRTAELLP